MQTENSDKLWSQLQRLAEKHSQKLFAEDKYRDGFSKMPSVRGVKSQSWICVDEDHKETVEILGSGDDERVCARIHWYLAYYPSFFDRKAGGI